MVAKFCFRSQGQPPSGSRRRAMMASRRSSASVAEGRGAAGKLSGEFAGGLSVMAGRLGEIRGGWKRVGREAGGESGGAIWWRRGGARACTITTKRGGGIMKE